MNHSNPLLIVSVSLSRHATPPYCPPSLSSPPLLTLLAALLPGPAPAPSWGGPGGLGGTEALTEALTEKDNEEDRKSVV